MIDTNMIYSVITRLEISKMQSEIQKTDPNAFIVMHNVKDLKGGMGSRTRASTIKKAPFPQGENGAD